MPVSVNRANLAGRNARAVFRNEARVIELAEGLSSRSHHPQLVRDQHQVVDEQLAHLVDADPAEVWRRLDTEPGALSDILDVANKVATVDGAVNARERAIISELQDRCDRV